MPTYLWPQNFEFFEIEPVLMRAGLAGRLGLQIMPIRPTRFAKVRWEQKDNYRGLQEMRGLDGSPVRVNMPGTNIFEYEPGYYGEFMLVPETELTKRAENLASNQPIQISDLVSERDVILLGRELDRQEWACWQVLLNGTITVYKGQQVGWSYTFPIQTKTTAISWSVPATSTPIADLQALQQDFGLGTSNNYSAAATMYMNSYTANLLSANTNPNDLGGRTNATGGTFNTLTDVSQFLVAKNLPKVQVYDGGYINDLGAFEIFIPNNVVLVMAARPSGSKIGEYLLTLNAAAGNQARSYRFVKDTAAGINAPKEVPPRIEVHRGHNGGPVIYYPSAVLRMNV